MFQFPAFAFYPYVFRIKYLYIDHYKSGDVRTKSYDLAIIVIKGGFSHSDIAGSKLIRSSPTLFAAYHVLLRLCVPRHPPDALKTLDHSHCRYLSSLLKKRYNRTTVSLFFLGPKLGALIRKDQFHEIYPVTVPGGSAN